MRDQGQKKYDSQNYKFRSITKKQHIKCVLYIETYFSFHAKIITRKISLYVLNAYDVKANLFI